MEFSVVLKRISDSLYLGFKTGISGLPTPFYTDSIKDAWYYRSRVCISDSRIYNCKMFLQLNGREIEISEKDLDSGF